MSPNRPYLIRALYDWISDNDCTPQILVDASLPNVRVPQHAVKDGRVVLNIAMQAVANLELGNELLRFSARFSGQTFAVVIPVAAVLAIYARENGEGMIFPPIEPAPAALDAGQADPEQMSPGASEPAPNPPDAPPPRGAPRLRVIK